MPKKTARRARRVKVTRASAKGSAFTPNQIKLGLMVLGIVLLFVLPLIGILVIAAVLFHHYFMGKR